MPVKYLTDEKGHTTDVQLSVHDYFNLLERAIELPEHVKNGIKRGQLQASQGIKKSTDEVMRKYKK